MKFTAHEFVKAQPSVNPDAYAAGTNNGAGVDCRGFREALCVLDVGDITATGILDGKIQDSADNSTFADVTGAAIVQLTAAGGDGNEVVTISVDLEKTEQFLRWVTTGATAAADHGASIMLLDPKYPPAVQDTTAVRV